MRPIDADILRERLQDLAYDDWNQGIIKSFADVCNEIIEIVEEQPTVNAVPVRHGKWIPCAKSGLILTEQMRKEGIRWYGFKCSVCGFIRKGNATRDANYCECCGARMVKDE